MIKVIEPTVQEDRVDSICFNLIILDIFFVPLFPWFSISISLPILLFWYITRWKKTKFEKERRFFGIVTVFMIFSTLFNSIGVEGSLYNTTFGTSCKRLLQYLFSFWYFFFFLYFFSKYNRKISRIIFWGIIYITLFAVIFSFNRDNFIYIKHVLCPFDPQTNRWFEGQILIYRFNYLWADPNNVAYAVTSLTLFYLVEQKNTILQKYIVLSCLSFILLCTMSIGGNAVAFCLVPYILISSNTLKKGKYSLSLGLIAIAGICLLLYYYFDYFQEIYNSGIVKRQLIYGSEGIAGGGGRWNDFIRGIKGFQPLFLLVGSGQEGFVSEIGHFYLICMYGIPVYIYFMYILFGKRKGQTFIEYSTVIPIFIGFTMNIAIGEQKFLLIALLIAAYYAARPYRKSLHKNENLHFYNDIR